MDVIVSCGTGECQDYIRVNRFLISSFEKASQKCSQFIRLAKHILILIFFYTGGLSGINPDAKDFQRKKIEQFEVKRA